jgi:hypothetical protein
MMAFLYSDIEVINFTVGWNGLLFLLIDFSIIVNLLDTFYSLNASKITQSAGNLCLKESNSEIDNLNSYKGSSETIRESSYDLFKKNYAFFFKEDFIEDNN